MNHTSGFRMLVLELGLALLVLGGCAASGSVRSSTSPVERHGPTAMSWNFDGGHPGEVPVGWQIRETNPTEALATWQVVKDRTAPSSPNVLGLTRSKNYDGTYNLAVAEGSAFKDLDLTVRVKAVAGKEDQGGGPIWRCRDENNYYICRFNPLEGNYRVYVVRDGRRKQLESVKVDTAPDRWYTIRVTMIDDHITCYLDGEALLDTKDATFTGAGMVGLWTKADAVTSFDDLVVRPLDRN